MKTKADDYTDEIIRHLNDTQSFMARSQLLSAVVTKLMRDTNLPDVLKKGVLEIVRETYEHR
jgi:hypothetical protein